jgi:hypothetical protein
MSSQAAAREWKPINQSRIPPTTTSSVVYPPTYKPDGTAGINILGPTAKKSSAPARFAMSQSTSARGKAGEAMPAKAPVTGKSPTKTKTATPTSRIGNAHELDDLVWIIWGKYLL